MYSYITISRAVSYKEMRDYLGEKGYKLATLRRILYNLGFTKGELKEKEIPRHVLDRNYAWKSFHDRAELEQAIGAWLRGVGWKNSTRYYTYYFPTLNKWDMRQLGYELMSKELRKIVKG